jgi:hypothetical protein
MIASHMRTKVVMYALVEIEESNDCTYIRIFLTECQMTLHKLNCVILFLWILTRTILNFSLIRLYSRRILQILFSYNA